MSHAPGPPFLTRFLARSRDALLLVLSLSSWVVLFLSPLLLQSLLFHDPIGFLGWDGGINHAWRTGVSPLPNPRATPTTAGLILLWFLGLITLGLSTVLGTRLDPPDTGLRRAWTALAVATGPAMIAFALLCLAFDAWGLWRGGFVIETALMHKGQRHDSGHTAALAAIGLGVWLVVAAALYVLTKVSRIDDWSAALTSSLFAALAAYGLKIVAPSYSWWGDGQFTARYTATILFGHAFLWSYATSVALLLFMPPHVKRLARRRPDGMCNACGYDLRGTRPGASCPECGAPMAVR